MFTRHLHLVFGPHVLLGGAEPDDPEIPEPTSSFLTPADSVAEESPANRRTNDLTPALLADVKACIDFEWSGETTEEEEEEEEGEEGEGNVRQIDIP